MNAGVKWVQAAATACVLLAMTASTAFSQQLFKLSPPVNSWKSGNIQMTLSKNVLHPDQGDVTIDQVTFYYNKDNIGLTHPDTVTVGTVGYPFNGAFNSASGPVPGWTNGASGSEGEVDDEFFIMARVEYTHSGTGASVAIIGAPDPDGDVYSAEPGGHPIRIDNQRPRPATLKELGRFVGDDSPYRNENFFNNFFSDRRMIGYTVGDVYDADPVNGIFTEEYRGIDGTLLGDPPYTPDEKIYVCSGFNPLDYVSFDIAHTSIAPPAGHVDEPDYEDWDTAVDHWDTTITEDTNRGVGIIGYKVDWDQTAPDTYEATTALNSADSGTYDYPIDRTDLTDGDTEGDSTAYWLHVTTFDGVRTGQNTIVYNRSVTVHYGPIWKITTGPVVECPADDVVLSGCDLSTDPTVSVEVELEAGGTTIIQIPLDLIMADDPATVPDESDPAVLFELLGGVADPPTFADGTIANLGITLELMTDLGTLAPSSGTGCADDPFVYTLVYRATDDCGNYNECTWEIQVADLTPPEVPASLPDALVQCEEAVPPPVTTIGDFETAFSFDVVDNCSADEALIIESTDTDLTNPCGGTITRTYSISDECGNAAEVSQTIVVNDTQAPVLPASLAPLAVQCVSDIPLAVDTVADFEDRFSTDVLDNCSLDIDLIVTSSDSELTDPCGGTITRTYTVTDECGNDAQVSRSITVEDTQAPEGPASFDPESVQCVSDIPVAATTVAELEAMFSTTITDNCSADGDLTVSSSDTELTDPCGGTITRTYTVMDECENAALITQEITVADTEAPTAPDSVDAQVVECIDDIPPAVSTVAEFETAFGVEVSDNCSLDANLLVSYDDSELAGGCGEAFTRTYTIMDECENSTQVTQSITVNDDVAPTVPASVDAVTVQCEADIPAVITSIGDFESAFGVEVSDNCSDDSALTIASSDTDLADPCGGTVTRTYTITDECGNESESTQVITVDDTTAPEIDCPADMTVECTDSTDTAVTGSASATDNCDPDPTVTYSDSSVAGTCPEERTIERTWTATDACGNSSSCVQTIEVVDTTAPDISCPADVTIECDDPREPDDIGWATASNDCDPSPEVTWSDDIIPGQCDDQYIIERTWTATDNCGNASTCVQTIEVVDTTPPDITCPPDVSIECDEEPALVDTGEATATDNCDDDPVISHSDLTIPGDGDAATIERTWTATDNCGNSSSCVQIITVDDQTAPVITCPDDVTIECSDSWDPEQTGEASAVDNCDANPQIAYNDVTIPGNCDDAWTIERTWTATDTSGNSDTCLQVITVEDNTPPEIDSPDHVEIECDESTLPENTGTAVATDNCDEAPALEYNDSEAPGSCPQEKVITRTWTATDACGNVNTSEQTITVVDSTNPVVTTQPEGDTVEGCAEDLDALIGDWLSQMGGAEATDNCGTVSWTDDYDPSEITVPTTCVENVVAYVDVTFTAWDECDNSTDTDTVRFNVVDTTEPVITAEPQDDSAEGCGPDDLDSEIQSWLADNGGAEATDTCAQNLSWENDYSVESIVVPEDCVDNVKAYVDVLFSAYDECGNTANTVSARFSVVDLTAPTAVQESIEDCYADEAAAESAALDAVVEIADNCGGDVEATAATVGDCNATITVTLVDECGNETAFEFETRIDGEAPELTCPVAPGPIECMDDLPDPYADYAAFVAAGGEATDNCELDEGSFAHESDLSDGESCPETITRTYSILDSCGNEATCTQAIVIDDITPPTVDVAIGSLEDCYPDQDSALAAIESVITVADDGCSTDPEPLDPVVLLTPVSGEACLFSFTVTVLDECDNQGEYDSAGEFEIRIDNEGPEASQGDLNDCYPSEADALQAAEDALTDRVDACGGDVTVAGTDVEAVTGAGECMYEISVTLVDVCGNTTDFTFDPVRIDSEGPVCVASPLTVQLGPDSTYELTSDDIEAIAGDIVDACGGEVIITVDPLSFDCDDIGDNPVTVTAEDECGNVSTCETTVTVIDFVTVTVGTGYTVMYPDGNGGTPFELAGPGNWVTVPISACHCEDLTQLVFEILFDIDMLEYVVGSESWVTPKMNVSGPFANPDWVNIELGVSEEEGVGRLIVHIDSPTGEPAVLGGCGDFMSLMFRVSDDVFSFTTLPLDGDVIYATGMNGLEVGKQAEDGVIYADVCNWILDVDRNGRVDPHTDGVILYRALKYGHLTDSFGDPIVPILPPEYADAVGGYLPSDAAIVEYVDTVTDFSWFGQYFDSDDKADGPTDGIGGAEVSASRNGVYIYRNLAGFPTHIYPVYAPPAPYSPFVNPDTPLMASRGNVNVTVPSGHTDNLAEEDDINGEIDLLKILWCQFLIEPGNGDILPSKIVSGITLPLDPVPLLPLDWYVGPDKVVPLPQPVPVK